MLVMAMPCYMCFVHLSTQLICLLLTKLSSASAACCEVMRYAAVCCAAFA
jgi:hypothetical protein